MTGEPVTYEVNLVPDPAIEEAFDAWLDEHVADMLRLPGFLTAVVRTSQDPDSGAPQRTVQYELADKAALDTYFKDHAQRMRQQGLERFGDRFSATRRIMDRGHRISSAGPLRSCANCDSQLAGQYCAICGQRAKSRMITLWEMIREASDIIVSLDSKLWRTLGLLLFKPGRLTRDYLEGKRARFVAPLRLFLGLTLLFFFLVTIGQRMEIDGGFNVSADMEDGTAIGDVDPEAEGGENDSQDFSIRFGEADYAGGDQPDEDIDAPPIAGADTNGDTETSAQDGPCDSIDFEVPEGWTMVSDFFTVDRVEQACQKVVADKGAGFSRALIENLPAMMFFFVPLLAVFMKIIYLFTGRFFVEHLLFLVHYHSFFYFVTTLAILTSWFVDWAELPDAPAQVLFAVISLYVFYYLYRAMRVVYGQGRLLTIIKYVSLNVFYFVSLMLTFVITVGITVFSL